MIVCLKKETKLDIGQKVPRERIRARRKPGNLNKDMPAGPGQHDQLSQFGSVLCVPVALTSLKSRVTYFELNTASSETAIRAKSVTPGREKTAHHQQVVVVRSASLTCFSAPPPVGAAILTNKNGILCICHAVAIRFIPLRFSCGESFFGCERAPHAQI